MCVWGGVRFFKKLTFIDSSSDTVSTAAAVIKDFIGSPFFCLEDDDENVDDAPDLTAFSFSLSPPNKDSSMFEERPSVRYLADDIKNIYISGPWQAKSAKQ